MAITQFKVVLTDHESVGTRSRLSRDKVWARRRRSADIHPRAARPSLPERFAVSPFFQIPTLPTQHGLFSEYFLDFLSVARRDPKAREVHNCSANTRLASGPTSMIPDRAKKWSMIIWIEVLTTRLCRTARSSVASAFITRGSASVGGSFDNADSSSVFENRPSKIRRPETRT